MFLGEITKTGATVATGLLIGIGLVFLIRPETHEGVAVLIIIAVLAVSAVTGLARLAWRRIAPAPPAPPTPPAAKRKAAKAGGSSRPRAKRAP